MNNHFENLLFYRKIEVIDIIKILNERNSFLTLTEYTNIVQSQALKKQDDDKRNKFKGDMLEIFAALFFNTFHGSPRIGLRNYQVCDPTSDYGVDGIGINANGDDVAVQVKFRSNPKDLITYEDIAKTFTSGTIQHKLDLTKSNTIFILTNSYGANFHVDTVFGNIVRVINREIIKNELDNNVNFWTDFSENIRIVLTSK